MSAILVTLHIIVCTALIMTVLLQTGKGSDMGAAFGGGGSQTLFGSTGASTFLSKATTVAAIVFMLTCLSLAYISGHKGGSSIMPDTAVEDKAPADTKETSADTPAADREETPVTENTDKDTVGKAEETAAPSAQSSGEVTVVTTEESAPPAANTSESGGPATEAGPAETAVPDSKEADAESKTD